MSEITQSLQRELQRANCEIDQLRNQLRHALAEVTQLRAEMRRQLHEFSREIRVPLTTVLGFTDLLSVTHKENSSELNEIATAGHQLMNLVSKLEQAAAEENTLAVPADAVAVEVSATEPDAPATVLHIEDNETNFKLVETILASSELKPIWAENGTTGIASAAKNSPSLILLDLNLPDMHGSEVLQKLKTNPATTKIPVIVLSADIRPTQIEQVLQAGARGYLTKPFDIKRLTCLVDEALNGTSVPV